MTQAGGFDPDFGPERLSRAQLAVLGREIMLFAQLNDRVGLPLVGQRLGAQAMEVVAIDEWRGASPVYTRRMQRALGFAGDDVATIFKGLQLDVGFAHQYFDVRYQVEDARHGAFWLARCGALLDVEPFGERQVVSMCHHIEDPTFDATAAATHPRARFRPVHRPPRIPADRVPHCHWGVTIDPGAEPLEDAPLTRRMAGSRLARLAFEPPASDGSDGRPDYAGPFDPDFELEHLSRPALVTACRELVVQAHLVVRAFLATLSGRTEAADVRAIAREQWTGSGWITSERLRDAFGLGGDGVEPVLRVLQLHPAFPRGYTRPRFQLDDPRSGRLWLEDSDAFHEGDALGWWAGLDDDPETPVAAMVHGVDPRARCRSVDPPAGARFAWELRVEPDADPAPEPPPVALGRVSGVSRFRFRT